MPILTVGPTVKTIAFALMFLPGAAFAEATDFEDSEVGAFPAGWMSSMTHKGGDPLWQIARDQSSPAGEKVLAQLSTDRTRDRFPLAIYSSTEVVDGSITVRFKPVSGRVDQAAGIVWRYRDENNYYLVRANALEGNVILFKVENGDRSQIAYLGALNPQQNSFAELPVPSQRWSTLGIDFVGPTFTVSFDGKKLFETRDGTFDGPGKVGLWTKADSVTYFDQFEMTPGAERH